MSDGCGGMINCGTCSPGENCVNNQCQKVCHAGPTVQFTSASVNGCGLAKQPGQCNTNFCWVVNGSCDSGTATGIQNLNVNGTCNGQAMASSNYTHIDTSGGNATVYFDKESDVCYFGGCQNDLNISFNVTCCL
jgi:hypothetical protein